MKIIEINSCRECPWYQRYKECYVDDVFIGLIDYPDEVLDNCPLQDDFKRPSETIYKKVKRNCVVGFIISPDKQRIALIRKEKPQWQKGLLNGIGGKVEEGESLINALIREVNEEACVEITEWRRIAEIEDTDVVVHFFVSFTDKIDSVKTATNEKIEVHEIARLLFLEVVPNLRWLIPMCFDVYHNYCKAITEMKEITITKNK